MTEMKNLSWKESEEFAELLYVWLRRYTDEVIANVYPKFGEIYENEFAMHLLKELKIRTEKEEKDARNSFLYIVRDAVEGNEKSNFHVHCHPLEHAESYRDILYDMYIAD